MIICYNHVIIICYMINVINMIDMPKYTKLFGVLNNFEECKGDVKMGKTLLYPLLYSAI